MPSSTSSSERGVSAERLTAADRPGVAQPVPDRPVPAQPWRRLFGVAVLMVVALTAAWEWRMRQLLLLPGDLDDGASGWAEQRRRVDSEDIRVAIVGDSRILFDTDLARFAELTGVQPLQLALPGTNGRPFLQNLAEDADFKGLAIVGIADHSYFRAAAGLRADALDVYRFESPAVRGSFLIHRELSRHVGFLDDNYRLSKLVQRLDTGVRAGARSPYDDVWKVSESYDLRQYFLWRRLEQDEYLREHARIWRANMQRLPPVDAAVIAMTQSTTAAAVAAIRARGGEVVFVRPPSSPDLRVLEERLLPRARGWDALLAAAGLRGIHFEDVPVMRGLVPVEDSHLSRQCARVFTDAMVRAVAAVTPLLTLRADAPPPLAPEDCAGHND